MRSKIIAGNWKMNTTLADAHVLADGVRQELEHVEHVEVVLFPPTIWLTELARSIQPGCLPHLRLGAQNFYPEERGAFTGETSLQMIKEVAEYVLIGHSERVHLFQEGTELLTRKLQAAFSVGLAPILCIGEEKQSAASIRALTHTLNHLVKVLSEEQLKDLVVAYEPVWAIGTGLAATGEYAEDVASALRQTLTAETRILYGGSATEANAKEFLQQPNIDGLLIGGASLKLKSFVTICQQADNLA